MLNGAIYNFRELAAELSAAGHRFRTGSDTEVVMEAYRRWGTSCFEKFNGMWAILIVDLDRKVVVGSRDRIGIKPFYYALDRKRLLFASEPWAIAQVQSGGPAIGTTRFFEFLSGYPPQSAALSFFRGVHPVPAGTWFEIGLQDDRLSEPRFSELLELGGLPVRRRAGDDVCASRRPVPRAAQVVGRRPEPGRREGRQPVVRRLRQLDHRHALVGSRRRARLAASRYAFDCVGRPGHERAPQYRGDRRQGRQRQPHPGALGARRLGGRGRSRARRRASRCSGRN